MTLFFYYLLDDNLNSCKLPITNTNTNTNLYEATTSNINNSIIEWLDDTDESINENDILNVSIKIYHIYLYLAEKAKAERWEKICNN